MGKKEKKKIEKAKKSRERKNLSLSPRKIYSLALSRRRRLLRRYFNVTRDN
jgi:hypothetical protein